MAIIEGTEQDDILTGTETDDSIYGYGGNDTLNGGAGADWIEGGVGIDTLSYQQSAPACPSACCSGPQPAEMPRATVSAASKG